MRPRRSTQYFEMFADRAIYHDGWIASTKVMRPPWVKIAKNLPSPLDYPWELYDLSNDGTQYEDVAAKYPDKLKELQALFWNEAEKYQVLPLDSSVAGRLVTPRPSLSAGRTSFTWTRPMTGTPNGDAPSILNTSYNFKVDVEIPQGGGDGPSADAGSASAEAAAPEVSSGAGLSLMQKADLRMDKLEACRKEAIAKNLGFVERISFVRQCMQ